MTGIYLFGKDADGKRIPKEMEYLTKEELEETFKDSSAEKIIPFLREACRTIRKMEKFLESEGYVQISPTDTDTEEKPE